MRYGTSEQKRGPRRTPPNISARGMHVQRALRDSTSLNLVSDGVTNPDLLPRVAGQCVGEETSAMLLAICDERPGFRLSYPSRSGIPGTAFVVDRLGGLDCAD